MRLYRLKSSFSAIISFLLKKFLKKWLGSAYKANYCLNKKTACMYAVQWKALVSVVSDRDNV